MNAIDNIVQKSHVSNKPSGIEKPYLSSLDEKNSLWQKAHPGNEPVGLISGPDLCEHSELLREVCSLQVGISKLGQDLDEKFEDQIKFLKYALSFFHELSENYTKHIRLKSKSSNSILNQVQKVADYATKSLSAAVSTNLFMNQPGMADFDSIESYMNLYEVMQKGRKFGKLEKAALQLLRLRKNNLQIPVRFADLANFLLTNPDLEKPPTTNLETLAYFLAVKFDQDLSRPHQSIFKEVNHLQQLIQTSINEKKKIVIPNLINTEHESKEYLWAILAARALESLREEMSIAKFREETQEKKFKNANAQINEAVDYFYQKLSNSQEQSNLFSPRSKALMFYMAEDYMISDEIQPKDLSTKKAFSCLNFPENSPMENERLIGLGNGKLDVLMKIIPEEEKAELVYFWIRTFAFIPGIWHQFNTKEKAFIELLEEADQHRIIDSLNFTEMVAMMNYVEMSSDSTRQLAKESTMDYSQYQNRKELLPGTNESGTLKSVKAEFFPKLMEIYKLDNHHAHHFFQELTVVPETTTSINSQKSMWGMAPSMEKI
ncbi:hypothetical protein CROQUDRAFT_134193 [Cronartium quercuum f. sp. fusiforme G11]|uniref:Uncharacterized protein n=1 Tax=Cronartium quercuum f. sp. fusiforme G11 TaxID=708437 RepID=A0A9P6TA10_9BASI|nr:hypothetical protein CROQUDRAFT_134193 [Cronartium quercuum f. sp. fusiforme G11]